MIEQHACDSYVIVKNHRTEWATASIHM